MNCLTFDIRRADSPANVDARLPVSANVGVSLLGGAALNASRFGGTQVSCQAVKPSINIEVGVVCSVGVGRYEYLACSDLGYIRALDKGFIIVPKR